MQLRKSIFRAMLIATGMAFLFSLHAQKWPEYAHNGVVSSAQKIASQIGVDILKPACLHC